MKLIKFENKFKFNFLNLSIQSSDESTDSDGESNDSADESTTSNDSSGEIEKDLADIFAKLKLNKVNENQKKKSLKISPR